MRLDEAKPKLKAHVQTLRACCVTGSPLVFLGAAALLEYLSKVLAGQDDKGVGYKAFIRNWLSKVRLDYRDFRYRGGATDLPEQMYHVLRCGIVHSFSLIPDPQARRSGGRDRSIVLGHRAECLSKGLSHLSGYATAAIPDAAVFVAEDFVDDLDQLVDLVFSEAAKDPALKGRMVKWLSEYPLISAGY